MPRKTGLPRLQYGLFATPLEDMIVPNNPFRIVDAFVDSLDLEALGICAVRAQMRGASSFGPDILLKIYFYGYLNRIRSSRKLEAEYRRNVELIPTKVRDRLWLTERQRDSAGLHSVQPAENYVHFRRACTLAGPKRAFFATFFAGALQEASGLGSPTACSGASERGTCAKSKDSLNCGVNYFTDCVAAMP